MRAFYFFMMMMMMKGCLVWREVVVCGVGFRAGYRFR